MKLSVLPYAQSVSDKIIKDKTVIVIDVLRATSVMITALVNGARSIVPVLTVKEAIDESNSRSPGSYLLCGERNSCKIEGFHLGNSPLEYDTDTVKGKDIILTTTNGTRTLKACRKAHKVFVAAFINLQAIADVVAFNDEITLVCSGTQGKFSMDDGICAAMLIDYLSRNNVVETDDMGSILHENFLLKKGNLMNLLEKCEHLNKLQSIGLSNEVNYCLQTNITNHVPVYNPEDGQVNIVNRFV